MGPKLFLSASLLLGQAQLAQSQENTWVSQPGWTVAQSRPYTRSSTQTWTSSGGWTTTSGGWTEDRPALHWLGDKIGALFGRKTTAPAAGWRPDLEDPRKAAEWNERLTPEERPSLIPTPPVVAAPVDPTVPTPPPIEAPAPLPREAKTVPARTTSRRAPTRIALTPGGEITIEVVIPEEEPTPVKPATFAPKETVTLNERYLSRLGHAADYRSITGQLRISDGSYKVYYTTPHRADRMGGVLPLEMQGDLSPLRNGDLIDAQGSVLTRRDGTIVYRPDVIRILERE